MGNYIEGTMSNLFAVTRKNELITPQIFSSGIAGVMRRTVMEDLCPMIDETCFEADIARVNDFIEVFVTNALVGILPVLRIDQYKFEVGPVTRKLQAALEKSQLLP